MQFNPEKHHRKSHRMPGWDYSRGGKYYITICTRNRICCLGNVVNGEMRLNEMGKMANGLWLEIPGKFENTWLDEYVIMPNHMHGIVVMKRRQLMDHTNDITDAGNIADAGNVADAGNIADAGNVGTRLIASLHAANPAHAGNTENANTPAHATNNPQDKTNPTPNSIIKQPGGATGKHNPMLSDNSLGKIIRWFTGRCTYEFNKKRFTWYGWQSRPHDRIIRNDDELNRKRLYIRNNPKNWEGDESPHLIRL